MIPTEYIDAPADTASGGQEVEVLLFQIGGERFGTDASSVLRIDRPGLPDPSQVREWASTSKRALVYRTASGEGSLPVDTVFGVRSIPIRDLRRVPAAARVSDYALGFWLDGERPVLLVDLPRTSAAKAPLKAPPPPERGDVTDGT